MSKQVRLGIIGAGSIGAAHLRACRQVPSVAVAAVCDVHAGRARAAGEEAGGAYVSTDYRALLRQEDVDGVLVCTPNNTHMRITIAALKAGKHVLCEKPLAMNARQARRMVAAAEQAGRLLMCAQSMRYGAESQFLKRLAEEGRFGDIYFGKAMWLRRSGIPRGWFQDKRQSGGGPLIDLGVHAIDVLWWLMGRPQPTAAFGVTADRLGSRGQGMGDWGMNYNPRGFSVEDLAAGLIRFADGRALSFDITWAAHTADLYWLRILGTKGGAQLMPDLVIYETEGKVKVDARPQLAPRDAYAAEIEHFASCIRRGEEPLSPGSQAAVVMEMLDAVYRSAATGRAVSLARR